jgi:Protease inhibitor Inh
MIGLRRMRIYGAGGAKAAAALLFVAAPAPAMLAAVAMLAACTGSEHFGAARPEPASALPPPSTAPPVDLAGRWRLAAAAGGSCFMAFGVSPGADQGTIAPEGGCPENFFTSRKWTFEHGMLIIRDHKGQPLAQLSSSGDRFEGADTNGGALSLSR